MYVKNHVGINNDFVTGSPLYINVDILAGTPAYYASQYPFFKFDSTTTTQICKTGTFNPGALLPTTKSYFENVKFRQSTSNTADVYMFDFGFDSVTPKYLYNTIDLSSVPFTNIDCFECT